MEFVLSYLADRGVYAASLSEQKQLENGVARYLLENGIDAKESRAYYRNYLTRHLSKIAVPDLKPYFINYPVVSDVKQIVIEFCTDGKISSQRKRELLQRMETLYACGLGGKYVPEAEIKVILGRFA